MPSRLRDAIVTRWDDQDLGDSFPGDLWFGKAPESVVYPYCVLTGDEEVPTLWTSTSKFRDVDLVFNAFVEEQDRVDPATTLQVLLDAIEDAFDDFTPLIVPATAGHVITGRCGAMHIFEAEERVWQGTIDYALKRRAPRHCAT